MKHKKQQKIKSFTRINRQNITSVMIAKWFNYKSANSLRNSSSYPDILQGIEELLTYLEESKGAVTPLQKS